MFIVIFGILKFSLANQLQGCGLRKITRSPNYEIQVARYKAYMKKVILSGHPRAKVSCLRHPGALRAQP